MKPSSPDEATLRNLLDTLAQSRTHIKASAKKKPIIVMGEGSDLSKVEALLGRAKRKTITQAMVLSLIDVAKAKNKPERVKAYWNAYHCQNKIITSGGRLHGSYCKNRFCTLCCSVRKATIMNRYLPHISTWEDCHFITLTVRSIKAKELRRYCKGLLKLFRKIIEKYRKRHKRGKGFALEGIKSLECNFNPIKKTYNPHLHILVKNREMGELLISEWLSRFGRHASRLGQHIRKVEDKERDLIEIVKYGSKIFTESFLKKKGEKKTGHKIYVNALDNILSAMSNERIFDRFGFNTPYKLSQQSKTELLLHYENWSYSFAHSDWLNSETQESLSGFTLERELKVLIKENLDLESQ